MLMDKLGDLKRLVIGTVSFDQDLVMAGLSGNAIGPSNALENVESVVERLEQVL